MRGDEQHRRYFIQLQVELTVNLFLFHQLTQTGDDFVPAQTLNERFFIPILFLLARHQLIKVWVAILEEQINDPRKADEQNTEVHHNSVGGDEPRRDQEHVDHVQDHDRAGDEYGFTCCLAVYKARFQPQQHPILDEGNNDACEDEVRSGVLRRVGKYVADHCLTLSLIHEIKPRLPEKDQHRRENLPLDTHGDFPSRVEEHKVADVIERTRKEQKRYEQIQQKGILQMQVLGHKVKLKSLQSH